MSSQRPSYEIVNEGQMFVDVNKSSGKKVRIINRPGAQLIIGHRPARPHVSASPIVISPAPAIQYNMEDITRKCKESVVHIMASTEKMSSSGGSVWDTHGHIITNNHVLISDNLKVTLPDGTKYEAVVVKRYKSQDLAMIKLRGCCSKLVPVVTCSEISPYALNVGNFVFAIGFPLSCEMTVSYGHVSCFPEQPINVDGSLVRDAIQLDANINHGNSGGPIFNSRGECVGVIVCGFRNSGINYGIPLKTVTNMVKRFKEESAEQKGEAILPNLKPFLRDIKNTVQELSIRTGYQTGPASGGLHSLASSSTTRSIVHCTKLKYRSLPCSCSMCRHLVPSEQPGLVKGYSKRVYPPA